jgi:pimeloyl-ACP methyl ester carboxylesterase
MIIGMARRLARDPRQARIMRPRPGSRPGMFPGFTTRQVRANGITAQVCRGGTGPPVLLLHGYPQTHVMWHRVAPVLARRFTVVCPAMFASSTTLSGHIA